MCGRARCSLRAPAFAELTGVPLERWQEQDLYNPSYNVLPGTWLPVVRLCAKTQAPEIVTMKWGLIPGFHKPGEKLDHFKMFNARSETVHTSPVFRRLLGNKRCVILLNGFYEFKEEAKDRKQPYYVYLRRCSPATPPATSPATPGANASSHGSPPANQQPQRGCSGEVMMAAAGLWDCAQGPDGVWFPSVTLLTCDVSKPLAWLHDRMPVLLTSRRAAEDWLGGPLPDTCQLHFVSDTSPVAPVASPGASCLTPHTGTDAARVHHVNTTQQHTCDVHHEQLPAAGQIKQAGEAAAGSSQHVKTETQPLSPHTQQQEEQGGVGHASPGDAPHTQQQQTDLAALLSRVCHPYGGPGLQWHPVTPQMNNPAYQQPDCCVDVRTRPGSITSFFKPKTSPAALNTDQCDAAGQGSPPVKKQRHG